MRLGQPIKWAGGIINSWKHVRCSRFEEEIDCESQVFGFHDLTEEEQQLVKEELRKTDIPSHLKRVDPEDPEFLQRKVLPRVPPPRLVTLPLLPYQV